MPDSKHPNSGERMEQSPVTRREKDDGGKTDVRADAPSVSDHRGREQDPPVLDPTNPASKPYGTTGDQVANMEGEGQAQTPGQEPPAGINDKAGKDGGKGERH